MTVRARDLGTTNEEGHALYGITLELSTNERVTRERLVRQRETEHSILQVVQALKSLADEYGPAVLARAIREVRLLSTREAGPEVLARAQARKATHVDAIAAIDALP